MIDRIEESGLLGPHGEILWIMARLLRGLPEGWYMVDRGGDGARYRSADGLVVIVSGAHELDGRRWLHVSCSRAGRIPSWEDLRRVKDVFIGPDEYAVQVLPPRRYYVNICPNALHLFHCIDGHPLPEFSRGSGRL